MLQSPTDSANVSTGNSGFMPGRRVSLANPTGVTDFDFDEAMAMKITSPHLFQKRSAAGETGSSSRAPERDIKQYFMAGGRNMRSSSLPVR